MSTTQVMQRMAYTPIEVAQMLGVSVGKVTADLRSGELVGVRIGRVWRIRVEELDAYLERNKS